MKHITFPLSRSLPPRSSAHFFLTSTTSSQSPCCERSPPYRETLTMGETQSRPVSGASKRADPSHPYAGIVQSLLRTPSPSATAQCDAAAAAPPPPPPLPSGGAASAPPAPAACCCWIFFLRGSSTTQQRSRQHRSRDAIRIRVCESRSVRTSGFGRQTVGHVGYV